tara:strand:- start:14 stop:211 length:198 start_codon:yes stop_codon:yes gene_type:complete
MARNKKSGGEVGSLPHSLLTLLLWITLPNEREFGIHQGASCGLKINIVKTGLALGKSKDWKPCIL